MLKMLTKKVDLFLQLFINNILFVYNFLFFIFVIEKKMLTKKLLFEIYIYV